MASSNRRSVKGYKVAHRLRTFQLVLVGIFAVSAIATPVAHGTPFMSNGEQYPTTIAGIQATGNVLALHTVDPNNDEVKCSTATFSGKAVAASSEVTVHPTYGGCKAFGLNANVLTEGCDYAIQTGEWSEEAESSEGTLGFSCSEGKFIKITTATCEVQVKGQTALEAIELATILGPPADVEVTSSISGIAYQVTKDGIGCPLTGLESRTDGAHEGTATLQGEFEGKPIGVTVGV